MRGHKIAQPTDEFGAIVQAPIPSEDGACWRDLRLRFPARLLCGMKGAVEDADVSLGIRAGTVWAVRSKKWADLFEMVPVDRLAIKIPCSKLNAHNCFPSRSICNRTLLAPIQNRVHFRRIWLVVNHA